MTRYPREPVSLDGLRLDQISGADLVLIRHLESVQRPWTAAELAWFQTVTGFKGGARELPQ